MVSKKTEKQLHKGLLIRCYNNLLLAYIYRYVIISIYYTLLDTDADMLQKKEIGVKILAIYESSSFNPANFSCNLELSSIVDGQERSLRLLYNDLVGLRSLSEDLLANLLVESVLTLDQRKYLCGCIHKAFTNEGWNKDMKTVTIEFDPNIGW